MPFHSVAGRAFYRCCHWATFYGFTFGWSLRVAGRENLPPTGPVLLVSNHQSAMDPVLVGAGATRPLTYLARSTLWHNRVLARVIDFWGAVPIDRGFGKEGLQTVWSALDRGEVVLMFAEGHRTEDGRLQPLKPGVSLLLKRVTCPVVPVGIAGAFDSWPSSRKWPRLEPLGSAPRGRSLAVAFGPLIDPGRYAGQDRHDVLAHLQNEVRLAHEAAERIRRKPG
jgi:1-acyl-sn-glycerol-3-phosphate acyltransferase